MRVRQWMTPDPITVSPETSVMTARRLLAVHRVRHLPVMDGDQLVGMLSDRDLSLRDGQLALALSALQSDLLSGRYRSVDTVMSSPVRTVGVDDPIRWAVEDMKRYEVSGLPVLEDGRVVGIITQTDCMDALLALDEARTSEVDRAVPTPA